MAKEMARRCFGILTTAAALMTWLPVCWGETWEGVDDFSGTFSRWDTTYLNPNQPSDGFFLSEGRLQFIRTLTTTNYESSGALIWAQSLPSNTNWTVLVDAHLKLASVKGSNPSKQEIRSALYVFESAATIFSPIRKRLATALGNGFTNDVIQTDGPDLPVVGGGWDFTLGISFDSSTKIGTSFYYPSNQPSQSVKLTNLNMGSWTNLQIMLYGLSEYWAVGAGESWMDNFRVFGNVMLPATDPHYAFTNFVGLPGVSGNTDGTGTAARFYGPTRPAMDGVGNLFVADRFNHTIRKITPAGEVTTLAGMAGVAGSADGTGSAARFSQPRAVGLDANGNIFVPDWGNHTIRKVTPAGMVTTLAGSPGNPGWVDASGSAARFNMPECVAVDVNGNVFVAERDNFVIRKVTPAGVVTTLAGNHGVRGWADGNGSAALFNDPSGIAVDSAGNLFVGDRGNNAIRWVTQAGDVTTLAGNYGICGWADGNSSAAWFNRPSGVGVDNQGNIFVTEEGNHTIRKVTYSGIVTTLGGLPGTTGTNDGFGRGALFSTPAGVAVDSKGVLYVSDHLNYRITKGTASLEPPYTYTIADGAITVTKYTGYDAAVTIPSTINGLSVSRIGNDAFSGCARLASVIIPDTVTAIGANAFYNCNSLTNIIIPDSVAIIGASAFYNCYLLKDVTIGVSVTNIGAYAFYNCNSLTDVTIGNSVVIIGDQAFYGCASLTTIIIPNSVTKIGYAAFRSCALTNVSIGSNVSSIGDFAFLDNGLATISVHVLNPYYASVDGVLFNKSETCLITCPSQRAGGYDVPNTVTSIGMGAFYGCASLTRIGLSDSVTNVGAYAFYYCQSLTNCTMSSRVVGIGEAAFYYCTKLTNIILPENVVTIGYRTFYACISLTGINLPNGLTNIGAYAFYNCTSLTNVTMGTRVTAVGDFAFFGCTSLAGAVIGNSLAMIGVQAFSGCSSLTSIDLPNGLTNIGAYAFYNCTSLTNVTMGTGVTGLGEGAFSYCTKLANIIIAESLTSIRKNAFVGCADLRSITIPRRVTAIQDTSFLGCTSLTGVFFQGDAPSLGASVFLYDNSATVYYLPGTAGWGPTFGGRPTALWVLPNPLILPVALTSAIQTNGFSFVVSWATNISVVVETSTDVASAVWLPLCTNTFAGGLFYFNDLDWTNHSMRLYRIRSQ